MVVTIEFKYSYPYKVIQEANNRKKIKIRLGLSAGIKRYRNLLNVDMKTAANFINILVMF